MGLVSLREYARWLRHQERLESIWVANLTRNGAGADLLAEHREHMSKYERHAVAVEARIAELEAEQSSE